MKKIGKHILTASVSGTLALMGAPPETGQAARNPEMTSFQPAAVHLVGTLTGKGTKYFLSDPKSGAITELRGKGLKRLVGMNVTVDGKLAGKTGSNGKGIQIVAVDKISGNVPASVGSSFTAGPGTKAVLVGGAVAGTVGGLYGAGVLGDDDKSASRK